MSALLSIVPSDRTHLVTFFRDYAAKTKTEERLTLEDLAQRVKTHAAAEKDALPWLKLARFGGTRKESGSLRTNENVVAVTGAVVDYDGENMSPEDGAKQLYEAGIAALVYTSPSHTDEKPRWRAVCPFGQELPPEGHYKMVARLNGLLGGVLAAESFTLSQSYYFGSVNGNPGHRAILVDGTMLLDECDELDEFAIGKPNGDGRHHAGGKPEASIEDIRAALDVIPNPVPSWGPNADWNEWNNLGMAVWRASGGSAEGFKEFDRWSSKSPIYDGEETEFRWRHYFDSPPSSIGFGKLVYWARERKPDWRPPSKRQPDREPLRIIDPRNWHGKPIPERRWVVQDWVPRGVVTSLYGPPGIGKSLLALQLLTSTAVEMLWLGMPVNPVRSLGVFCEDDDEELHRRQADINRELFGCGFADLGGMRLLSRLGEDNILMTFARNGRGELTGFFDQLAEMSQDLKVELIAIDTVADTFGGNQNDAGQVRQFVQFALARLARIVGGAVLACAHPSRAGQNSGTGESGSVQWDATVRSRLYLSAPVKEEGESDPDPNGRVLSRKKANYAARDDAINLFWHKGVFKTAATSDDEPTERPDAQTVFLTLLDQMWSEGQWVSHNSRAPNYAPKLFAKRSGRQGYRMADFERAMQALFEAREIGIVEHKTPDRKNKERIARSARCDGF
jgi:RecA-family ATPase